MYRDASFTISMVQGGAKSIDLKKIRLLVQKDDLKATHLANKS